MFFMVLLSLNLSFTLFNTILSLVSIAPFSISSLATTTLTAFFLYCSSSGVSWRLEVPSALWYLRTILTNSLNLLGAKAEMESSIFSKGSRVICFSMQLMPAPKATKARLYASSEVPSEWSMKPKSKPGNSFFKAAIRERLLFSNGVGSAWKPNMKQIFLPGCSDSLAIMAFMSSIGIPPMETNTFLNPSFSTAWTSSLL